jgi:hypothetical protein
MTTAIVLAGITLTEMGADLRLTVDTCDEKKLQPVFTPRPLCTKCGYLHRSKNAAFFIMCKECFKFCQNTQNFKSAFQAILGTHKHEFIRHHYSVVVNHVK